MVQNIEHLRTSLIDVQDQAIAKPLFKTLSSVVHGTRSPMKYEQTSNGVSSQLVKYFHWNLVSTSPYAGKHITITYAIEEMYLQMFKYTLYVYGHV